MKRLITFCIISFGMLTASMAAEKHPADYVNPFVGTTNFGTTNPGAVCPNGMMSQIVAAKGNNSRCKNQASD